VAVHAIANVGGLRTGQNVLVMGAGPVGLLAMGVAKGLGAGRIIAVDINLDRLKFAQSYAATDFYVPVSAAELCIRVLRFLIGRGRADDRYSLDQATGRRDPPPVLPAGRRRSAPQVRHSSTRAWLHRPRDGRYRCRGLHPDGSQRYPTWVSRAAQCQERDRITDTLA
jgi:hypothetical protein